MKKDLLVRFDHIALTVKDIKQTAKFYSDMLGMEVRSFEEGRTALHFGDQKINLDTTAEPSDLVAARPIPGSADLCFITTEDVRSLAKELEAKGIEILLGPMARDGALGEMASIYFRDPDGNLIEIANY